MKRTLLLFLMISFLTTPYSSHAQENFQKLVDEIIVESGTSLHSVDFYQASTFMGMPYEKEYPEAVVYNGEKIVLIAEDFKTRLDSYVVTDWAAALQLSHEMAHHLKDHEFPLSKEAEQRADEFTGKVLNDLGATRKQLTEALESIAESNHAINSKTKVTDRLEWLVNGWQSASVIEIGIPKNDSEKIAENVVTVDEKAMTAEKVLRQSLEAMGGIDKIKKIDKLYQHQKNEMKMNVSGTDVSVTTSLEMHYLDSSTLLNKITTVSSLTPGTPSYIETLVKDDKVYTRTTSSVPWTYAPGQSMNMISNSTNYIQEYKLLEKAYTVNYLGKEEIEGQQYYVLETPEEVIVETPESKTTEKKKYYYNVDTGLLTYVDWDSTMGAIVSKNWVHYLDYRSVSGILYSFKQEMKSDMVVSGTQMEVSTTTTYPVIEINPDFDESMFNVN